MKEKLAADAAFLLETGILKITGNPNLEIIKTNLEKEIGKKIILTIDKQEGNYIEATFTLEKI